MHPRYLIKAFVDMCQELHIDLNEEVFKVETGDGKIIINTVVCYSYKDVYDYLREYKMMTQRMNLIVLE